MRNIYVYVLVILGFVLVSCERDEDIAPLPIVGTWEHVSLNHTEELDSVITNRYNPDGTYTISSTLRNIGEREDLGYNFFINRTYRVEGNELIFVHLEQLEIPKDVDKQFFAKEELVNYMEGFVVESSHPFEIRNNGQELVFPREVITEEFVIEEMVFRRVE